MQILRRLIQLIKQARVSKVSNDSSPYPTVQVDYNGKTSNAIRLSPYGLCTNPPLDSNILLFSANAQESNKYAIIDDMPNRFKNLKEGEVVLYNYQTESYIYLKENGDIDVICKNDLTINVDGDATVDISGDATVDVGGSLTAEAGTSAEVTAPTITLNGPVTINGSLTVAGGNAASFSGTLGVTGTTTIEGQSWSSHAHSGVQSGGSNTGGVV